MLVLVLILNLSIFCALEPSAFWITSRIVDGFNTTISTAPHCVLLRIKEPSNEAYSICSASILNQNILLTAAHCVDKLQSLPLQLQIAVGFTMRKPENFKEMTVRVVIYEKYVEFTFRHDISLIMLKNPLTFGANVKRVAIMRTPPETTKAMIFGWGRTDMNTNALSDQLKGVEQEVLSRHICSKLLKGSMVFQEWAICSMNPKGALNYHGHPSKGDSGAALLIHDYIQIGILSFGNPTDPRRIVVYTNVSYFYDWIKENTQKMFCDSNN